MTGGYTGVGYQLARILYAANSTLYIAGRSPSKGESALASLRKDFPSSKGRVEFLQVDLADLSTIKSSAETFLSKESRLDVLINNAAVMVPPEGSRSAQGFDLTTATNIYGPWLFTVLLLPLMKETAKTAERGSVRVSWAASSAVDLMSPKGGVAFGKDGLVDGTLDKNRSYGQSKSANVLLGVEGARRWAKDGIISNVSIDAMLSNREERSDAELSQSFNPGNLRSELQRHVTAAQKVAIKFLLHPVKMGAWTELYAGKSSLSLGLFFPM